MTFRVNVACMISDVSMLHGREGQNVIILDFHYFGFSSDCAKVPNLFSNESNTIKLIQFICKIKLPFLALFVE